MTIINSDSDGGSEEKTLFEPVASSCSQRYMYIILMAD